jgi:hypothetical protein
MLLLRICEFRENRLRKRHFLMGVDEITWAEVA